MIIDGNNQDINKLNCFVYSSQFNYALFGGRGGGGSTKWNENFYLKAFSEKTRDSLQRSFGPGIQKTCLKQTKIYILCVNFKIRSYTHFFPNKCHVTA